MFPSAARRASSWALAFALLPCAGKAEEPNWLDVESRIQYGYYTEDVRALTGVMAEFASAQSVSLSQSYYTGLGNYRVSQLTLGKSKDRAKEAAAACVSALDQALKIQKDFAEGLALQSACLEMMASLTAWRTPFAASKSGVQLQRARHVAPGNPRVLLLDAVELDERPQATAAEKDRALSGFRKAAAAFEAERQETVHAPGWGAAEAYTYLGRCYLDRGATLQARDALERALLIAPEFAEARRLMTRITSG
jgi:tetratricopeptide (TPR) repeat protein